MEIQTRAEDGSLEIFSTFGEAWRFAKNPVNQVWKISFSLPTGERVRLVRSETEEMRFEVQQMEDAVSSVLDYRRARAAKKWDESHKK